MLRSAMCALLALALVACGGDHGHDHDHDHGDHGHDHGDHGHDDGKQDGGHAHAGERHTLGKVTHDGVEATIVQVGELTGELVLEVEVAPAGRAKVMAVRAWVGAEDGKGSVKAKASKVDDGAKWDVHAEAPATAAAGQRAWVAVETAAGTRAFGFPIAGEAAGAK